AGGAAEISRRRRRKQSEKTPSPCRGDGLNSIRRPCRGWEVGRTQFRWFHRRPISAVPPGRELISQHAQIPMGQTRDAFELLARLACWRVLEEVPDYAHEIPFGPFVRQRRVEGGNDGISVGMVRVPHRLDARRRAG